MNFPLFKYHPDQVCLCCDQKRGFIYTGPVYATDELDNKICPWCIADGSAAEKFEAVFTDEDGIGEEELAVETQDKVARRTPGFAAWQQERWLSCCNDAAAFLGPMGNAELKKLGPSALEALRAETGLADSKWNDFFASLDRHNGPTAYVFQCLHCSSIKAYCDCA